MTNKSNLTRNKIAARWQEITAAPNRLRALAENVSQVARHALAESKQLIVERQEIYLPRLPRELDKFCVVQLSDIHHSPFTDAAQIIRFVEIANELEPDLIVLTGDYVSHETEYIAPVAELLGKLEAKHGVFAVLGNHDHWTDAEMITDLLRAEGIRVLINEGLRFNVNNSGFWLCGVDDTMVGLEDLSSALSGSRENEFKFLLSHNPAILRRAERAGVDFIVSGHTHGGQVRLRPSREKTFLPRNRRATGLIQRKNTQIYVSRGIGTVVLPVRYQCPPEISLLKLRSSNLGF
jgi:predicted MPP superfamily phosphohydrolase